MTKNANKNRFFMIKENILLAKIGNETFFFSDTEGCSGAFRVVTTESKPSEFNSLSIEDFKNIKNAVNNPESICTAYESLDYKEKDFLENSKELILETIAFYEKNANEKEELSKSCNNIFQKIK